MTKLRYNESGFGHLPIIAAAVLVVAVIGIASWRVASNDHKTTPLNYSTTAKRVKAKIVSSTPAKSVNASTTSSSTSTPKSSTSASTSASSTTSTSPSSSAASAASSATQSSANSFVAPVPAGYTDVGTVSAATLYNVKVPPASSEQPAMTIYACLEPVNSSSDDLQFLGVLASPVTSGDSSNWYVDLDLSSSSSADNVISSKTATYSYSNNTWDSSSAGDYESNIAVTDLFNPGVITDYYVWAYGSYGGTTLQPVSNHLNVTQLATCQA